MKYRVELTRVEIAEIEVEADSEEKAISLAFDMEAHDEIDYEWEETDAKSFLMDEPK